MKSPDRFSRSGTNAIYITKELQSNHIAIKPVRETNTSTSNGYRAKTRKIGITISGSR